MRAAVACPSCGALCDDVDGPTHPYLAAPRSCWAAFGRFLTARKQEWPALDRRDGVAALNHTHVAGATDLDDYTVRARAWAAAVWSSWSPEQARIRTLLDAWSPRPR